MDAKFSEAQQAGNTAYEAALPMGNEAAADAYTRTFQAVYFDGQDAARAIRAAALIATGQQRPYITTTDSCTCPDHQYRGRTCKHMIALRMQQAA